MSDSLSTLDCADVRRFWNWTHANSNADPLAGNSLSLGYGCVTDVCVTLDDGSGPMPLIEGTDYTVDLETGVISFVAGGATTFFKSDTTVVTAWFNVKVCEADKPCIDAPCCADSKDPFTGYATVRPPNCVPVPTVGFSPGSGTVQPFPVTVTLTASRSDALIYYTVNGSTPTTNSTLYSSPFSLTDPNAVVQAMAIVSGCDSGPVSVAQYIAEEEDMPLNSAVYDSGRDKIFAVRGGYVFQLNATTGKQEASSRFFTPDFDDTYIALANGKLWVSVWATYVADNNSSNDQKWLIGLDPDTLTVTDNVNLTSGVYAPDADGLRQILSHADIVYGFYIDYASLSGTIISYNPATAALAFGDAMSLSGLHTNLVFDSDAGAIWGCPNGSTARKFTLLGAGVSNVALPVGHTARSVAYRSSYLYFSIAEGPTYTARHILKKKSDNTGAVIAIDTGRANALPFNLRYRTSNDRLYVPTWKDNTIVIIDPTNDTVDSVKTGFDSPFDVVFTPTKAFAVQHGPVGLKEIV